MILVIKFIYYHIPTTRITFFVTSAVMTYKFRRLRRRYFLGKFCKLKIFKRVTLVSSLSHWIVAGNFALFLFSCALPRSEVNIWFV
jgi:hypothetical protein